MARGASLRMGATKGLLPCPGTRDESFATRIVRAYEELDFGGILVCTANLAEAYAVALTNYRGFRVVGAVSGGETGLTLQVGWRALPAVTTHIWAHPVDLPLVGVATLEQLKTVSEGEPERIVRPAFGAAPGHPVIVPVTVLETLSDCEFWKSAPVRDVFADGRRRGKLMEPLAVPVGDCGVVEDFDQPSDFERR